MPFPLLIVTGPIGVGKTSVVAEIAEILNSWRVPSAAVDMDWLASYFPRPADDPFGIMIGLENLAAVWATFQRAGSERLVLAAVIDTPETLALYRNALPDARITVCRLRAPVSLLQERTRQREIGSALDWHLARAAELAAIFERHGPADLVIDVPGRPVHDIALDILTRLAWRPNTDRTAGLPAVP